LKIGEYAMLAVQILNASTHRRRLMLLTCLTFIAMC